jgi:hypothetical protein
MEAKIGRSTCAGIQVLDNDALHTAWAVASQQNTVRGGSAELSITTNGNGVPVLVSEPITVARQMNGDSTLCDRQNRTGTIGDLLKY